MQRGAPTDRTGEPENAVAGLHAVQQTGEAGAPRRVSATVAVVPDLDHQPVPSGPTLAAVLGHALGRHLAYVPMTPGQVRQNLAFLGDVVAGAVAETYAWEGTHGTDQLAPDLTHTRHALEVTPTPIAVWAGTALAPAEQATR